MPLGFLFVNSDVDLARGMVFGGFAVFMVCCYIFVFKAFATGARGLFRFMLTDINNYTGRPQRPYTPPTKSPWE